MAARVQDIDAMTPEGGAAILLLVQGHHLLAVPLAEVTEPVEGRLSTGLFF
jgi:hypothetical protein